MQGARWGSCTAGVLCMSLSGGVTPSSPGPYIFPPCKQILLLAPPHAMPLGCTSPVPLPCPCTARMCGGMRTGAQASMGKHTQAHAHPRPVQADSLQLAGVRGPGQRLPGAKALGLLHLRRAADVAVCLQGHVSPAPHVSGCVCLQGHVSPAPHVSGCVCLQGHPRAAPHVSAGMLLTAGTLMCAPCSPPRERLVNTNHTRSAHHASAWYPLLAPL